MWQLSVIFFLCLFCYSNSFHNSFMMDDYVLLPLIKSTILDFDIFSTGINGHYRPLGVFFLKIIYMLCGANTLAYHVCSFILFFIICSLFLFIINRLVLLSAVNPLDSNDLIRARRIAFISAVLYCVHPINNEIINYKTTSMLVMYIICMQLSFLSFLIFIDNRQKAFYFLSVFMYLGALLYHEVSAILPVYLFLVTWYLKKIQVKRIWHLFLPYLLCFIFYFMLWKHISVRQPDWGIIAQIPIAVYLATIAELLQWYLSKLFFPHNVLFMWDVPIYCAQVLVRIIKLLCLAGGVGVLYYVFIKVRRRVEIFGLTIWIIGFIPFLGATLTYFHLTGTALITPHWFYFASIGFFMLIASLFVYIGEHWGRWTRILVLGLVVVLLAVATRQGNMVWKDGQTYCKYWIRLNSFNVAPVYYLEIQKVDLKKTLE